EPAVDGSRGGAPSHRGPGDRAARPGGVASRERRRRLLRGREHRQHGGHRPRDGRTGLAGRARPAGAARGARRGGDRGRRLAVGRGGGVSAVLATSGPTAMWYLTRGSGAVSLVLLTASVVMGVVDAGRWRAPGWPRFVIDGLHRNLSL